MSHLLGAFRWDTSDVGAKAAFLLAAWGQLACLDAAEIETLRSGQRLSDADDLSQFEIQTCFCTPAICTGVLLRYAIRETDETATGPIICWNALDGNKRHRIMAHKIKPSETDFKTDFGAAQHSTKSSATAVTWHGNLKFEGIRPNLETSQHKTSPNLLQCTFNENGGGGEHLK